MREKEFTMAEVSKRWFEDKTFFSSSSNQSNDTI
jgi:hypothetical protein